MQSSVASSAPETSFHSRTLKYIGTWAALMVSLLGLLWVSSLGTGREITFTLGLIATGNALLMLGQFMHLGSEPRVIRWLVIGAAAAMVILLFGLVPDIAVLGDHVAS